MRRGRIIASIAGLLLSGTLGWLVTSSLTHSDHVYTAVSQARYTSSRTVRYASPQHPVVLRTVRFMSHGGTIVVEWYDGARNPLGAKSGSYVSLSIDGHVVTGTLRGGKTGRDEAGADELVWTGQLPTGSHTFQASVSSAGVQVPHATPQAPVVDGLIIREYVRG